MHWVFIWIYTRSVFRNKSNYSQIEYICQLNSTIFQTCDEHAEIIYRNKLYKDRYFDNYQCNELNDSTEHKHIQQSTT